MIKYNQNDTNVSVDVEKQGYVEANFARHGRLAVVEEAPLDKNGNPLAPESFVVRGEPFHDINFTIVPAARPAVGIVILHDSGYKILTRARFATAERITLEPWGRITGQYTVNGKPPKGQRLSLTAEPHEDKAIREIFRVNAQQTTDAKGRFTFDRLLPGTYHITSRDKMQTIKVKPGESVTVNFAIAMANSPTPPLPGTLNVAVTTDGSCPDALVTSGVQAWDEYRTRVMRDVRTKSQFGGDR